MNYPATFKNLLITHSNAFIGNGNPISDILIIGKEVATDVDLGKNKVLEKHNLEVYKNNAINWTCNIEKGIKQEEIKDWNMDDAIPSNNPLFAFKGAKIIEEGKTWKKYQKLHDFIFPKNKCTEKYEHNFQERFFITEMSELNSKISRKAQSKNEFKEALKKRKDEFLTHEFIKKFPVIVFACSNYISGKEIEKIFDVKFAAPKGDGKQLYWTHFNNDKLVIHTRQLSSNVSNNLLIEMANEIRVFLKI